MLLDVIWTFLISISPVGEARAGMPWAFVNTPLPAWLILIVGLTGNLLVFPLFYAVIGYSNKVLWKRRFYKKSSVYLSRRAKNKVGGSIDKYGVWGLMIFVMIPLPITGAYIGTIAAFVLGMDYKKALFAVSLGVTISCVLIALGFYFGDLLW